MIDRESERITCTDLYAIFPSIGESQKRSELTRVQVTALLHEHNERNNENCCLRITAKKLIAQRD